LVNSVEVLIIRKVKLLEQTLLLSIHKLYELESVNTRVLFLLERQELKVLVCGGRRIESVSLPNSDNCVYLLLVVVKSPVVVGKTRRRVNDVAEVHVGICILCTEEAVCVLVVVRDLEVTNRHRSCAVARSINLFELNVSGEHNINVNVFVV
jgi:hypothetical protein